MTAHPASRVSAKPKPSPAPDRPRFDETEVANIEAVLSTTDPRLALLLTIQGAQRAGQLLRARRSGLTMARTESGEVRAVLQVPGSKSKHKRGGRHFVTPSAAVYLAAVLESGYLRELEREYQAQGTDYYLFPGSVGTLAPGVVVLQGGRHGIGRLP